MNTTTSTMTVADAVEYVADRCASREVDALSDFWAIGRVVATGEATYDAVRDALTSAFKARDMQPSTAKVYLSQGVALATLFDSFDALIEYADDEVGGSRSLKRIYDATRRAAKADDESGDAEAEAELATETTDADRAAAILAILASMTDASAIASVRDAASAMLVPAAA